MHVFTQSLSRDFETTWAIVHQAPLSMEFSKQQYWNALPFLSPEDLLDPWIETGSPVLQADSLPSEPPGVNVDGCNF